MRQKLLLVTTAKSGEQACSNAQEFIFEYENFLDSYNIHGAISTESEIFKNSDCDFDNVFDKEINSYDNLRSLSMGIANQHLNYQEFFKTLKEDPDELDWIVWYGASKYCTWRAELSKNGIIDLEDYNLLEDEIFPVDFSLHQIAHYSYESQKDDEGTWIVLIDIKL